MRTPCGEYPSVIDKAQFRGGQGSSSGYEFAPLVRGYGLNGWMGNVLGFSKYFWPGARLNRVITMDLEP